MRSPTVRPSRFDRIIGEIRNLKRFFRHLNIICSHLILRIVSPRIHLSVIGNSNRVLRPEVDFDEIVLEKFSLLCECVNLRNDGVQAKLAVIVTPRCEILKLEQQDERKHQ